MTGDDIDAGDGQKFGYGFTYVRGGTGGLLTRGRNGSDAISALHWQASWTFSWWGLNVSHRRKGGKKSLYVPHKQTT